jgi:hypothetical protein
MWNSKENVLAVSIQKCSPRSYGILQSLFTVPSRRTLHSLLNNVQLNTGMNAHEFSILKDNVQTTSDEVQVCCLMFDKMSIRRLIVLEALRTLEAMAG